jgi:hypothetical protein
MMEVLQLYSGGAANSRTDNVIVKGKRQTRIKVIPETRHAH